MADALDQSPAPQNVRDEIETWLDGYEGAMLRGLRKHFAKEQKASQSDDNQKE